MLTKLQTPTTSGDRQAFEQALDQVRIRVADRVYRPLWGRIGVQVRGKVEQQLWDQAYQLLLREYL